MTTARFMRHVAVLFAVVAARQFSEVASFLFNRQGFRTCHKQTFEYVTSSFTPKAFTEVNKCMSTCSSSKHEPSYYECLVKRFQGDFDNYNQVVEDRRRGLLPAEGGGHEHIHCTLVPCPKLGQIEGSSLDEEQWVIAAFYLNGNPKQIFRFRMYRMIPPQNANAGSESMKSVRLKLHTLDPELDQCLRGCSEEPWTWWNAAYSVWSDIDRPGADNNASVEPVQWQKFQSEGIFDMVSQLKGCDVIWDPNWNPSNHSYLYQDEYDESATPSDEMQPKEAFHATMEAGPDGVIVDSISMIPGKRILIKDELSLWENEFWINDRGYDPDADTIKDPVI